MTEHQKHGKASVFFPFLIILVGVYLLAYNLDYFSSSPWSILGHFWPLILVAIGLDMLFSRAPRIVTVFAGILFVFLSLLLIHSTLDENMRCGSIHAVEKAISIPLEGVEKARLKLDLHSCNLDLSSSPEGSGTLVRGSVLLPESEEVITDLKKSDDLTRIDLRSGIPSHQPVILCWPGDLLEERSWDLEVTCEIPVELLVELDVGKAELDLLNLDLSLLDMDVNAGSVIVTLPAGIEEGAALINLDTGKVILTIPEACAARLHLESNLSEVTVDSSRFPGSDEYYESDDYDTAACRWDISIDIAVGSVEVR